jgi:hypothetical protein
MSNLKMPNNGGIRPNTSQYFLFIGVLPSVMATGNTLDESTTKLQQTADDIATWARK